MYHSKYACSDTQAKRTTMEKMPSPQNPHSKADTILKDRTKSLKNMVGGNGLEPSTSTMSTWRSNQLS